MGRGPLKPVLQQDVNRLARISRSIFALSLSQVALHSDIRDVNIAALV